jgi:hypothetical protein
MCDEVLAILVVGPDDTRPDDQQDPCPHEELHRGSFTQPEHRGQAGHRLGGAGSMRGSSRFGARGSMVSGRQ